MNSGCVDCERDAPVEVSRCWWFGDGEGTTTNAAPPQRLGRWGECGGVHLDQSGAQLVERRGVHNANMTRSG